MNVEIWARFFDITDIASKESEDLHRKIAEMIAIGFTIQSSQIFVYGKSVMAYYFLIKVTS